MELSSVKTCKQMADIWGISIRTVNELCKNGKIPGTEKIGKEWKIPDNAVRPADGRISSGKYAKKKTTGTKPLPIGISDYVRVQAEYYYVDKTLLIQEFLDQKPLVSLFTRPRRFGKTLNMDMLRVFFEISEEDTGKYFTNKAIWKCGEEYRKHQGQYPVIFLTFKDVKFDSWDATMDKIQELLQAEFGRHSILESSEHLAPFEKVYFQKVLNCEASEVDLASSLERLSQMLTKHYRKAPIIIIDEYDTPIQEGYSKDFYDEIVSFMRNFFSGAFKDNKNLTYGFLTGILRIAQESIFSGLNNLTVNSVMDDEYDRFFGFTESEVKAMLAYYGISEKEDELKAWYDGYLFGNTEIYNPWSVINYISKSCIPQAYWVNTGKNEVLEDVLAVATGDITEATVAKPIVTISANERVWDAAASKYVFTYTTNWSVPEGYTFVKGGFIYRYGAANYGQIDRDTVFAKGTTVNSSLKVKYGTFDYTLKMSTSYATRDMFGIGFIVVKDQKGVEQTIYSDTMAINHAIG